MSALKVLLVGNYVADGQESMLRFCEMLERGLAARGVDVRIARPRVRLRQIFPAGGVWGKWLGYLDKYVLFPPELKASARWADVVHICDHSNAVYIPCVETSANLITCHDLLAVRAALGEQTHCLVSVFGKVLQRWILGCLPKAALIVCDSQATRDDARRLLGKFEEADIRLVYLGLNFPYRRLEPSDRREIISATGSLSCNQPYILNVGDTQPRKNRDGVLRIFARLKDSFEGQLVFAGQPLSDDLYCLADELGVRQRIVEIVKPDNQTLEHLYNQALVLLFPSYAEGFGWPLIEAQACGCPVICSDRGPLREVAGDSALVRSVDDEQGFASDISSLKDPLERSKWVQRGLENVKRFDSEEMVSRYLELYREVIERFSGRNRRRE